MARLIKIACTLLFTVIALTPLAASCKDVPSFEITLKPIADGDRSAIANLEITLVISQVLTAPEAALLELADVTFNVPSLAGHVAIVEAYDEAGQLPLVVRNEGEKNAEITRWFSQRKTDGSVTVRYRVPTRTALAPRGPAPPTELRNDAGALSGAGASFLLRPPEGSYILRTSWDLSALPADASAVSSLGYQPSSPLPPSTLDSVYFMAGQLGHFPPQPNEVDFFSAWQGNPPFDAAKLMATARALRESFIDFFSSTPGGYGIMLRPNPVNAGGGIGLHHSFVITFDKDTAAQDLLLTLSHEMYHTFQPRLDAGGGPNSSLETAWFNEGLAVFYQREFLFQTGLIDSQTYLEDINTHAARYYTNVLGNTPNSEVAAGFWLDTRIRTLPYDRGFLYFATVDEALREASGNRRSLDDLTKELRQLQDEEQSLTPGDWERLLQRELGEEGPDALHAMLSGASPLPSTNAFGPCFKRTTRVLRRYELGFDPAVLTSNPRIIEGLVKGSEAERAGLRNGDQILKPVPQDAIQADQHALLKLQIRRGDESFDVQYLPRGEAVDAWQWELVRDIPEQVCRAARNGLGTI